MTPAVWIKVVLWWIGLVILAILNGALRERVLIPSMGSFAGLIASGIVLSALVFIVACIAMPRLGRFTAGAYWIIGAVWLALTVIFEFGFGLFVERRTMAEVLRAYTFSGGNIWILVLAATLVSPWLAAHARGLLSAPRSW